MAKSRKGITQALREKVVERDGARSCAKCGRIQAVEVHHIVAVSDGGANELDNLVQLCSGCHNEWHALERVSHFPFQDWLEYPPVAELLPFLMAARDGRLGAPSLEEAFNALMESHERCKSLRRQGAMLKLTN